VSSTGNDFCSAECLLHILPANAEKISARVKNYDAVIYRDDTSLYFPLLTDAPASSRPLGTYECRHYEALKLLKDNPVEHIAPVTALCHCYHGIAMIKGDVMFNANSIPKCFDSSQGALIRDRDQSILWNKFKMWMLDLATALRDLHRLGLAHGDITTFNAIIDKNGHAFWIDLENLNFDPVQMDCDIASFIFHVVLFAAGHLKEMPLNFLDECTDIWKHASDRQEFIEKFIDLLQKDSALETLSMAEVRSRNISLARRFADADGQTSFHRNCQVYFNASAIHFQRDFLWLINGIMPAIRHDHSVLADIYQRLVNVVDNIDELKSMDKERIEAFGKLSNASKMVSLESSKSAVADRNYRKLANKVQLSYRLEYELRQKNAELRWEKAQNILLRQLFRELSDAFSGCRGIDFHKAQILQILRDREMNDLPGWGTSAMTKFICSILDDIPVDPGCELPETDFDLNSVSIKRFEGLDSFASINCPEPAKPLDVPDESLLISIVLPVYNQAEMISEAIDSILAQDYRNWELIIVNDGSTDNVAEVVAPYLTDRRIFYLEQKNQYVARALSNGFAFASGEFLTWTSADNIMEPQMLRRLSAFLRSNSDTAMVYADYTAINGKGEPLTEKWYRPHNRRRPDSPEIHLPHTTELLNLVHDNFIGASFMYRHSVKMFFEDYEPTLGIEDYDYWMRINSMLNISHLGTDELLYRYRVHDKSLSAHAKELKIREKAMRLLGYDRERQGFYFKEFEIYGSFSPARLKLGEFFAHFHGQKCETALPPHPLDKKILLIRGDELASYTFDELRCFNFIGVYFAPGQANEVGKNAFFIRRFKIQCFAASGSEEMRRIKVLTPHCMSCLPGEIGFFSAIIANNRIFFDATHKPEELKRELPLFPEKDPGRIIILMDYFGHGGMEQVAYDMVRSFRKAGRNTLLVSVSGMADDLVLPEGIEIRTLDANDPHTDYRTLLASEKTDAVIAHYCTWGAWYTFEQHIPYFQVIHNTYVWFSDEDIAKYTETSPYTTAYIAVSANVAWYAMEKMKLPPEKMIIVENGVNIGNFKKSPAVREKVRRELGFKESDFVMLNPASCYGAKNQLGLIHAFAKARMGNSNLKLVMAGTVLEPYYFERIRQVIDKFDLQDHVICGRYFDNMPDIYNAVDAVVLPSFWEGCSLAVVETIHMHLPLLATNVGDVQRQTDCRNCLLVDLPFKYLTELDFRNYTETIWNPDENMVNELANAMHKMALGNYPIGAYPKITELNADNVYDVI